MDGLQSKTLLRLMIWGYHYFRKHPYDMIISVNCASSQHFGEVPWITHPSFSAHVSRTAMMMSPEMTRAALKTARRSARGPWNSSWLVSDAFHLVTLEFTGGMPKQNGEVQKHGNNHWWIMVKCDELWWIVMNYHALMNWWYFPMATKIGCLPIVWPCRRRSRSRSRRKSRSPSLDWLGSQDGS